MAAALQLQLRTQPRSQLQCETHRPSHSRRLRSELRSREVAARGGQLFSLDRDAAGLDEAVRRSDGTH